jgi:hypothetical protein
MKSEDFRPAVQEFASLHPMKWIWVIVLAIIGVLAAIVAIEYFTVAIHHLPSFLGRKHGRGHYRKRGAGAALIAFVTLAIAGFLTFRNLRADKTAVARPASGDQSADQLLSSPSSEAGGTTEQ